MTDELRAKFEAYRHGMVAHGCVLNELDWIVYQDAYKAAHASRDAEVENLRDKLRISAEHLDDVLAEVEALKRDAERYRWLRNNSLGQWEHPIVVSQTKRGMGMLYVGPLIGIELDKAIDAAMAKEQEDKCAKP